MSTPVQDPTSPRDRIVDGVLPLFAERGFYGVSLSAAGDALGVTKQALLHHFGSKEQLYGAVLDRVSARYLNILDDVARAHPPEHRLHAAMTRFSKNLSRHPHDAPLLMRELLDNPVRAAESRTWYLRPFLDRLTDMALNTSRWRGATRAEALAGIYQLLGAIHYRAVSGATLIAMFGPETVADMDEFWERELFGSRDLPRPSD